MRNLSCVGSGLSSRSSMLLQMDSAEDAACAVMKAPVPTGVPRRREAVNAMRDAESRRCVPSSLNVGRVDSALVVPHVQAYRSTETAKGWESSGDGCRAALEERVVHVR